MNYTDDQLKKALTKMLPEQIFLRETQNEALDYYCYLLWRGKSNPHDMEVRDTEMLHLCWLVEDKLTEKEYYFYADVVCDLSLEIVKKRRWFWLAMTWQQRVEGLAKVKGIDIV